MAPELKLWSLESELDYEKTRNFQIFISATFLLNTVDAFIHFCGL
jgi:hypothetical protein